MSDNKYIYKRKDGGEIWCYGKAIEDMTQEEKENGWCFSIACADDEYDIELTTIDVTEERHNSWNKVCSILENLNMFKRTTIEQITYG
jgi:hypothetical protein